MSQPTLTIDLEIEIDYGQVYIYSASPETTDATANDVVLRALDDARQSGRWVGVADGLIDFVVPFRKRLLPAATVAAHDQHRADTAQELAGLAGDQLISARFRPRA